MKLPISKLSSEELEILFEESECIKKFFFPPEVPTISLLENQEEMVAEDE
ncbi:MAG: hypothetical protein ACR2M7_02125 [Bdellovibrionales bacterium]